MDKQQEFLWIVQTAIIVNAISASLHASEEGFHQDDVSMTGNWGAMQVAVRASKRIPEQMSANDAANDYCTYMLSNQKRAQEKGIGHALQCPEWFVGI